VAVIMVLSIVIDALVFAMTHARNLHLARYSLLAVDHIVAIFLATLWFQAIYEQIALMPTHHSKVLASALNAIGSLLFLVAIAWMVRGRPALLSFVGNCGSQVVGFSAMLWAYMFQKHYFSQDWLQYLIGCFLLLLFIVLIAVILHGFKKVCFREPGAMSKDMHDNAWSDTADDIENNFWAFAVAVLLTDFFASMIAGRFPLLSGIEDNFRHTRLQRMMLLGWAFLLAVVGLLVVPRLKKLQYEGPLMYPARRVVGFLCLLLQICAALAFMCWGQWHVYEKYRSSPIFARIVFALICTAITLLSIFLFSQWPLGPAVGATQMCGLDLLIRTLCLIVAWSWELVFDATFIDVPFLGMKIIAFFALGLVLMPVSVTYLKPITNSIYDQYE